jgi:predicted ABC-type ATPase
MDAKRESVLEPTCWIIAGPNGAGKTTFALRYLRAFTRCRRFVNADLIAAGLSPLAPELELAQASRLFLREIDQLISLGKDFAFETTLSGRSYLALIDRLHNSGWSVKLIYLALSDIATSRMRVVERVSHGGHDVPERDLRRRFPRSLHNLLNEFSERVDEIFCFLNDSALPRLVFAQKSRARTVVNEQLFQILVKASGDGSTE